MAPRPGRDVWKPPIPLGHTGSVQSLGGFAAPLLAAAGFGIVATLLPSLAAGTTPIARWPEVSTAVIVASSLAQIAAVQSAVWARHYDTTPDELSQWYPGEMVEGFPSQWLRGVQLSHERNASAWAGWARRAYHLGIMLLLLGLTLLFVPPGDAKPAREVLIAVPFTGLLGEFVWLAASTHAEKRRRVSSAVSAALLALAAGAAFGHLVLSPPIAGWYSGPIALCLTAVSARRALRAGAFALAAHTITVVLGLAVLLAAIVKGDPGAWIWPLTLIVVARETFTLLRA